MALLTTLPLWLSGVLLVGGATLIAMAAPAFVRRHVSSDRLRINNEVAGFTFATVGVLYAVLLAFAVIIVWENSARRNIRWLKRPAPRRPSIAWRMASGVIPASPSATA
jgi:hypothetical protein